MKKRPTIMDYEGFGGTYIERYEMYAKDLDKHIDELEAKIEKVRDTMKHARTFITSREKMHPTGVELYDKLYEELNEENNDTR